METNLRLIKLGSNICTGSAGGNRNRYNDIDLDHDDAALTGKLEKICFGTWVDFDTRKTGETSEPCKICEPSEISESSETSDPIKPCNPA